MRIERTKKTIMTNEHIRRFCVPMSLTLRKAVASDIGPENTKAAYMTDKQSVKQGQWYLEITIFG